MLVMPAMLLMNGVETLQGRQCWGAVSFAQAGSERAQRDGQRCQDLKHSSPLKLFVHF